MTINIQPSDNLKQGLNYVKLPKRVRNCQRQLIRPLVKHMFIAEVGKMDKILFYITILVYIVGMDERWESLLHHYQRPLVMRNVILNFISLIPNS